MASNYGPHFGVRRLDEDIAIREGGYKTPASGSELVHGSAVEINFAAPGFMKQCADAAPLRTGISGLLISEDSFLRASSIDKAPRSDITDLAYVSKGKYAVITSGPGIRVWFRNVAASTGIDSHSFPEISLITGLGSGGVDLGDYLEWDATAGEFVSVAAEADGSPPPTAWMQVVELNDAASYCEATLLR